MSIKRLPFSLFKKIYSQVPRLTVEVIVQTSSGIVLTKRTIAPYKNKWCIPGGTVLKGETLKKTVARVAKEELNIKVSIVRLLGVLEYRSVGNYFGQPVGVAFLVKPLSKKFICDEQSSEIKIFNKLPTNIPKDQSKFLLKNLLIK